MRKKLLIIMFTFLFLLVMFGQADAIRIGPSRIILNFDPNLETTRTVCIKPSDVGVVEIGVRGTLAQYITLEKTQLIFKEGEGEKCVTYTISLPETLPPGQNEAIIYASDMTVYSGAVSGISTIPSVGQQLWVIVPYPGKYLTAKLSATDARAGEPVGFTISLDSKGNETISKVSANIELINQNNLSLGVLPTTEVTNLKPGTEDTLRGTWSPSSKDVGTYRAIATIYYDSSTAEAEAYFRIGEVVINIVEVTSPPIEKGEIGKIDVSLESVWISRIPDVLVEVRAAGKTAKSETIELLPWSTKTISVYFPTEEVKAGEYPATATVYYSDKTAQKEFTITVFEEKNMFYFMAGASIALAIIIVLIIIFFIKQRDFKRRMHHAMYWQ